MWNKTLIHKHFHLTTAFFFFLISCRWGFFAQTFTPLVNFFPFSSDVRMELKRVAEVATSLSMEFSRSPAADANDPRSGNSLPVIFYDLMRALKAITCDISFPQQRFRSAARGPAWHLNLHLGVDERHGAYKAFASTDLSRLQQETFA